MKTPGDPTRNDDLEARLRATFDRAVARAGEDLAVTDLVSVPLAAGRRPRWRATTGALAGVAAVVLVGVALIVGSGGRKEPVLPSASPGGLVGSPVPSAGSPAPADSADPGDGEGIPVVAPGITFPPSVDGRPVVSVGPEADAHIAAATDDTPFALAGWLLGWDPVGPSGCNDDFDRGSPAPNGVYFKDCTGFPIRATKDGGDGLRVYFTLEDPSRLPRRPSTSTVMRLLVEVHVHDAGCTAADCVRKPVFDRVLMYGVPLIAPPILASTMPPNGISMEQAVAAARAYDESTKLGFGEPKVLLSVHAGPLVLIDDQASPSDLDWYWLVRLVSDDGYMTYSIPVGFLDGSVHSSSGGSPEFP